MNKNDTNPAKRLKCNRHLAVAKPELQRAQPADLDLQTGLIQACSFCSASHRIHAVWTHSPYLMFSVRPNGQTSVRFNTEATRHFGLKSGMTLGIFSDVNARYLILQNVRCHYESHMHQFKLGTHTLQKCDCHLSHTLRPETCTEGVQIVTPKRRPLSLLKLRPDLDATIMPVYQLKDQPDVLIANFSDLVRIPTDLVERSLRRGGLVRSNLDPHDPDLFRRSFEELT